MTQPRVTVPCRADYGREKTFYFVVTEDGIPLPNYCEDSNGSQTCQDCAVTALKLLIARLEDRQRNEIPGFPYLNSPPW